MDALVIFILEKWHRVWFGLMSWFARQSVRQLWLVSGEIWLFVWQTACASWKMHRAGFYAQLMGTCMRVKKMARKQKRRTGLPSPNIGVNKIMHRMFTIINCVGLRESEHWEPVLQHRFSFYALKSTYTTIGVYFVCRILLNGERFLFYFYYFSLLCFCSGEWNTAVYCYSRSRDKCRHNWIASFDFSTIFLFFISYGIVSFSIRLFLLQIWCFHSFFLCRIFEMNNA